MAQYIGPWEWGAFDFAPEMVCYHAPAGTLQAYDLRTLDQMGTPGDVANEGNGIFELPDAVPLPATYLRIPDAIDRATQLAIEQRLGITGLVATTRRDLIVDLVTRHADPTGATFCKPLMPEHDGVIRFTFADVSVEAAITPAHPLWPMVLASYHAQYRELIAEAEAGLRDPLFHRRWITALAERFTVEATIFIPPDLPHVTPLPHATTWTESFNKADSVILGPDLSWTDYENGTGGVDGASVISQQWNGLLSGASGTSTRADADVTTDIHSSQIQVVDLANAGDNQQIGPCTRFSSSAQTHYFARAIRSLGQIYFDKFVAGTITNITGPVGAITISVPQLMRLESNGNNHKIFYDGAQVGAVQSDPSITVNTRGGIFGYTAVFNRCRADNFVVADLAAGPTGKPDHYFRMRRL